MQRKLLPDAGNRFAGEHAVLDRVFGLAAVLGPAVEVFAVEQIDPAVLRGNRRRRKNCRRKQRVKMDLDAFIRLVNLDGIIRTRGCETSVFQDARTRQPRVAGQRNRL